MKKSTIKSFQANGTYNGQHGTLYKFEVTLADGTVGNVNAKSQAPWWGVGIEVAYTITGEFQGIPNLKLDKPDFNQGGQPQQSGNKDMLIARQTCIKASAEFHAQRSTSTMDDVIRDAEIMRVYCETGEVKLNVPF